MRLPARAAWRQDGMGRAETQMIWDLEWPALCVRSGDRYQSENRNLESSSIRTEG